MKVQKLVIQVLLLSALAVVLTVGLGSGQTEVLAAPSLQGMVQEVSPVEISLESDSLIVDMDVKDTFTVDIKVDAGAQEVSGVQTFLDFDRAVLEVVDADPGKAGIQMLGGANFPIILTNSADNVLGQIDYAAGNLTEPPSGAFVLATVTFKAKAASSATAITLSQQAPRNTFADFLGDPYPFTSTPNQVVVKVQGTPRIVSAGQAKVLINAKNAQMAAGFQFALLFNKDVVQIAPGGVVGGSFPGGVFFQANPDNVNGRLTIVVAGATALGVPDQKIADVTFNLIGGPGTFSDLTYNNVLVSDAQTQPLGTTLDKGRIDIGSSPPSDITLTITVLGVDTTLNPTLTPTPVPSSGGSSPPGGVGGSSPPTATPRTPRPALGVAPIPSRIGTPTPVPAQPSVNAALVIAQIEGKELLPPQAANKLREIGPQDAAAVARNVDPLIMAEIFGELEVQFAAEVANQLGSDQLSDILSEVPPARAGSILALLDVGGIAGVVENMDANKLVERLPELPPEMLFQISPQLLFDKLPQIPVEQLIFELPPKVDPSSPPITAVAVSEGTTEYNVPRTSERGWVELAGASDLFDRVVGKFNTEITNVKVRVLDLRLVPTDVPDFPLDMVVQRYFRVALENASSEDMTAVHMTIPVAKSWLQNNNIHNWSVHLVRFDEELNQWVPFTTKRVGEDEENITYTVVVPGFSLFALAGSATVPEPAFEVADLVITPSLAIEGEEVLVTARVRNLDSDRLIYPANLWLNDTIEESKEIRVEPGQTAVVSFMSTKPGGDYRVRLDRLSGQFSVSPGTGGEGSSVIEPTEPGAASEATTEGDGAGFGTTQLIIIVIVIVLGVAALGIAALYLIRSSRTRPTF